jgi:hypothetical protein
MATMTLKLAVAIIIDETCKEPDLCIDSVLNQVGVDHLALDVFVCSVGEFDLPQQFVQLQNLTVINGADPDLGVAGYLHKLTDHVKDHDWVWAINSNHYIHSKNALTFLADSLAKTECEHVEIASVGIAGKSFDSSIVDVRSLTDLCNTHGFFEILGNPSSLVVRGYAFMSRIWPRCSHLSKIRTPLGGMQSCFSWRYTTSRAPLSIINCWLRLIRWRPSRLMKPCLRRSAKPPALPAT